MNWRPAAAFFGVGLAAFRLAGCANREHVVWDDAPVTGSAQLALRLGGADVDTATAVLSREGDATFQPQTQSIDVHGEHGVISVYFGNLPAGSGYSIELRAGDCSGSEKFSIEATTTTLVDVNLLCASNAAVGTGSAQIVATIDGTENGDDTDDTGEPACDLIAAIVAAPAVQVGAGVDSAIEVLLKDGVTASSIGWVVSSEPNHGLLRTSPESRLKVSFDCRTDGTVELVATVQALVGDRACSEQARAVIQCVDQPDPCADGACDAAACGDSSDPACPDPDAPDPVANDPGTADGSGACSDCTRAYCGAQLDAVYDHGDSVAPILACVLGGGWQAIERASVTSCANSNLFGCYCGSVAPENCVSLPPSALDGQCRTEILTGTGCTDSACVKTAILSAENPSGNALEYVQCQQDYCYDSCYNP